jgi:hypothetical protein
MISRPPTMISIPPTISRPPKKPLNTNFCTHIQSNPFQTSASTIFFGRPRFGLTTSSYSSSSSPSPKETLTAWVASTPYSFRTRLGERRTSSRCGLDSSELSGSGLGLGSLGSGLGSLASGLATSSSSFFFSNLTLTMEALSRSTVTFMRAATALTCFVGTRSFERALKKSCAKLRTYLDSLTQSLTMTLL